MSWAVKCDETGLVDFVPGPGLHVCQCCGQGHEAYECGPGAKAEGMPIVIGDRMPRHFDYSLGCEVESKSQERRLMQEKGLRYKSLAECRSQGYGGHCRPAPIMSYAGQKKRSSRPEGVRTKTGQRIV